MSRFLRSSSMFLALPMAMAISSCSDGLESSAPSSPTGTTTPTPAPTATPAATPVATPVPTPTPNAGLTCQLATRPDCGNNGCCPEGGSAMFSSQINDAQAHLERTRPEIFNSNGSLRLDELEYTDLLAKTITSMFGLCAVGGGRDGNSRSKDEVGIKSDNNVSQNIDVIIGSSHQPYIGGRHTCRPASF